MLLALLNRRNAAAVTTIMIAATFAISCQPWATSLDSEVSFHLLDPMGGLHEFRVESIAGVDEKRPAEPPYAYRHRFRTRIGATVSAVLVAKEAELSVKVEQFRVSAPKQVVIAKATFFVADFVRRPFAAEPVINVPPNICGRLGEGPAWLEIKSFGAMSVNRTVAIENCRARPFGLELGRYTLVAYSAGMPIAIATARLHPGLEGALSPSFTILPEVSSGE